MALGLTLASDLEAFFANAPGTEAECAEQWGTAIRTYTTGIVPAVDPATQDAAKLLLVAGLAGMSTPDNALTAFDTAFSAYASALAAAMVPPGALPPPALLSLTLGLAFTANNAPGVTHAQAAAAIAVVIDLWFRTGVSSTSVPWS